MTPRQVQVLIGVGVSVAVLVVVLVIALVVGWEDPVAAPTSIPTSTSSAEPTSTTLSSSTTASTSSTTTSSTTSTSPTITTSTSTTTTTTLPSGACLTSGAGPIPAGDSIEREAVGDFDGDGAEDRFLIYRSRAGLGDLVFRVELSYGWAEEVGYFLDVIDLKVQNLGGPVDLAVAVTRDHGGNHARFIVLADCDLDQAVLDNGEDAVFWLENEGDFRAGVTCTADGIRETRAEDTGGGDWEVYSFSYTWNPDALLFEETGGVAFMLHSPQDDAAIQGAANWDC